MFKLPFCVLDTALCHSNVEQAAQLDFLVVRAGIAWTEAQVLPRLHEVAVSPALVQNQKSRRKA